MATELDQVVWTVVEMLAPVMPVDRDRSSHLVDDLGFTSVGLLDLMMELTLELDIEPPSTEVFAGVETYENLEAVVASLMT